MNTRTAIVIGLVTLVASLTGCAGPDLHPTQAQLPPRPVFAYGLGADHTARTLSLDQTTRGASVAGPLVQKREVTTVFVNRSSKSL